MGYALFANRKLFYVNKVNMLQLKLDDISMQRQNLLNFSANISDGIVTVDEIAGDASNFSNYGEFLGGYDSWAEMSGAAETSDSIGSMAIEQNDSEEYLAAIAELLNKALSEAYVKQYNKKIEAYDNQLEQMQKKYETQLTVAQQELQAVEQAEQQGIQNATPKYAGLG